MSGCQAPPVDAPSPAAMLWPMHIDSYSFGRIRVDGIDYAEDVILLRGEVRSPWWRSAGGHVFAPTDLEEVVAAAPEIVVLGTGYFGRVKVPDKTLKVFAEAGSEVIVEKTSRAVETFNQLAAEDRDVAAALHLTC
jgi:hypothetical protein